MTDPQHPDEATGGAVAVPEQPGRVRVPIPNMLDRIEDFDQAWRLSQMLASSTIVPDALRQRPANVMIIIVSGQELGLTWAQSIRHLFVSKSGTVGLKGELLLVKIRNAGHDYDFESTDVYAKFRLHRDHAGPDKGFAEPCDGKDYYGEFDLERAERAGLLTIDEDGRPRARSSNGAPLPWETYTTELLLWKAVARACRFGCPEVVFGYVLTAEDDAEPAPPLRAAPGGADPTAAAPVAEPDLDAARTELASLARQHATDPANVVDAEILDEDDPAHGPAGQDAPAAAGTSQDPPPSPGPSQAGPARSAQDNPPAPRPDGFDDRPISPQALRGLRVRFGHFGLDTDEDQALFCSVVLRRWLDPYTPESLVRGETAAILAALTGISQEAERSSQPQAALMAIDIRQRRDAWRDADPGAYLAGDTLPDGAMADPDPAEDDQP